MTVKTYPKKIRAPKTVGKLIELLQRYPASRRLGHYEIEVKTKNPCVSDLVAAFDPFVDDDEAWVP